MGLSIEEKRKKMKEVFTETKEVFMLKDLERICPKQKGIVQQTVKDVLTGLVNDGIVKTDKLGVSTFFWLFPSDEANSREVQLKKWNSDVENNKRKREDLLKQKEEITKGREESEERKAKISKLIALEKENNQMKEKLSALSDSDPALLKAMEKDIKDAKEAANRWTDIIFSLRSFCENNLGVDKASFDQGFEIPSNFDYVS
eukprot:TRINITY_DN5296_c0_g1_i1.p1 TRINITY_DN5296_c0_g1~~TRINITY_DN5296_c0_g1_i1.p1  ORF type:complete len:202 (+),score=78.74 TRINITY_DN5296_c0_g1_i1:27-632(+)